MPYKSKDDKREHDRDYIRQKRATAGRDDTAGTTVEMFEGKPRYLKLSDGQVLDRAKRVEATNLEAFRARYGNAMLACNRANAYRNTMSQQEKLGRLLVSLDKAITGLDGKKVSLLDTVRYGIGGPTFAEIKNAIK